MAVFSISHRGIYTKLQTRFRLILFKKVVKSSSIHFFPFRHLPVFPEKKLTLQKSSIF
jgi:hypothetical protein